MHVTLDQARALDALARHGTLQKAAAALFKGHTAVLYALGSLEAQCDLKLLDRSGYRLRITREGQHVLEHCRALLASEEALKQAVAQMRTGWEPSVSLVIDGIVSIEPVLGWMRALSSKKAVTQVSVSAEFLGGVEEAFERRNADFMISVLPPVRADLSAVRLPPVRALLVAHASHPLARAKGKLSLDDLSGHVLLTVRGGDPRLSLSTGGLEARSAVHLNDFDTKRRAIVSGLGFGWLPDHVAQAELSRGTLKVLRFAGGAEHTFAPHLYHREARGPGASARGPATTMLLEALRRPVVPPRRSRPRRDDRGRAIRA